MIDTQKNKGHLKQFNSKEHIIFCNAHDNIVEEIGSNHKCAKKSAICEQQCKKHIPKEKLQQHDYISSQKFLYILKELKDKYKDYHRKFIFEEIPQFLVKIKEAVDGFISMMKNSFNEETILAKSFCHFPVNDIAIKLLGQDPAEWNLSDLTCRQVHQILHIHKEICKQTQDDQHKNFEKHLKSTFIKVLISQRIIDSDQIQNKKKKINIDSIVTLQSKNIQDSTKAITNLCEEVKEKLHTKQEYKNTELILKINEEFLEKEKETEKVIEKKGETEENFFIQKLFEYVRVAKVRSLQLYVRVPVLSCFFWEKMRSAAFECGRLSQFLIYTTHQFFSELYIDKMKLFRTNNLLFRVYTVEWDQLDGNVDME